MASNLKSQRLALGFEIGGECGKGPVRSAVVTPPVDAQVINVPQGGRTIVSSPCESEPRQAVVASSGRSALFSCDSDLAHVANNYAKDACAYERTNTHLASSFGSLAMLLAMRLASFLLNDTDRS